MTTPPFAPPGGHSPGIPGSGWPSSHKTNGPVPTHSPFSPKRLSSGSTTASPSKPPSGSPPSPRSPFQPLSPQEINTKSHKSNIPLDSSPDLFSKPSSSSENANCVNATGKAPKRLSLSRPRKRQRFLEKSQSESPSTKKTIVVPQASSSKSYIGSDTLRSVVASREGEASVIQDPSERFNVAENTADLSDHALDHAVRGLVQQRLKHDQKSILFHQKLNKTRKSINTTTKPKTKSGTASASNKINEEVAVMSETKAGKQPFKGGVIGKTDGQSGKLKRKRLGTTGKPPAKIIRTRSLPGINQLLQRSPSAKSSDSDDSGKGRSVSPVDSISADSIGSRSASSTDSHEERRHGKKTILTQIQRNKIQQNRQRALQIRKDLARKREVKKKQDQLVSQRKQRLDDLKAKSRQLDDKIKTYSEEAYSTTLTLATQYKKLNDRWPKAGDRITAILDMEIGSIEYTIFETLADSAAFWDVHKDRKSQRDINRQIGQMKQGLISTFFAKKEKPGG